MYKAVIGIEMHCEMNSNAKVFSLAENRYSKISNNCVNEIDLAHPGTLPTVNKECVRKAIMAALILNCKVPEYLTFDRKNYYYPDLPKGFQITQMNNPIGTNGYIFVKGKKVLVHDIHLEEDTAALENLDDITLIDYNRCGVPLLELVTEPCFNNEDEVLSFIEDMCQIYRYTSISEADTKKGQIRCDVNVSIMDYDSSVLGTKVEVKGVNSLSGIRDVIKYEVKRQSELKSSGRYDEVLQETRRWDETLCRTVRMRTKIDDIDYKYFTEPNIPPYKLNQDYIESIKNDIPKLLEERREEYKKLKISENDIENILRKKDVADYFEECINIGIDVINSINYVNGIITAYLNKEEISIKDFYLKPIYLKQIIEEINNGHISTKQAKDIFYKSLEDKKEPKEYFTKENSQISDEAELSKIIIDILNENREQVIEYKNGHTNIYGYFVGQVMKKTKGRANPNIVNKILNEQINKR